MKRGGAKFELASQVPQFSSALGIAGAVLGNGAREALLATQKLYDLRVRSQVAPLLERVLRALRAAATVVGSLAGVVWVLGLMFNGLDVVR